MPPPALAPWFSASPRLGRSTELAVMGMIRLAGNVIKIQCQRAATAFCSHDLPSLKSGLGLCALRNVSINLSEQAAKS